MKRDKYYPRRESERSNWHANFAAKLPLYGPALGLSPAQIASALADNLMLAYAFGGWRNRVREFGTASTASLEVLESGSGSNPFSLPAFTPPPPPVFPDGITAVLPGALDRTFLLVREIKSKPAYTLSIGLDMGIVGSEAATPPPGEASAPRVTATVIDGPEHQVVRLKFIKEGNEGVHGESQRGDGGWEFLAMSTKSPLIDDRPLLVPGQAEVRQYRFRFYDDGKPCGPWTAIIRVTVGP